MNPLSESLDRIGINCLRSLIASMACTQRVNPLFGFVDWFSWWYSMSEFSEWQHWVNEVIELANRMFHVNPDSRFIVYLLMRVQWLGSFFGYCEWILLAVNVWSHVLFAMLESTDVAVEKYKQASNFGGSTCSFGRAWHQDDQNKH